MNLQENIQRIREMMISEEMVQSDAWKSIKQTLDILKDNNPSHNFIELGLNVLNERTRNCLFNNGEKERLFVWFGDFNDLIKLFLNFCVPNFIVFIYI